MGRNQKAKSIEAATRSVAAHPRKTMTAEMVTPTERFSALSRYVWAEYIPENVVKVRCPTCGTSADHPGGTEGDTALTIFSEEMYSPSGFKLETGTASEISARKQVRKEKRDANDDAAWDFCGGRK